MKKLLNLQAPRKPVAPPVYRPQATPKVMQPKMANGALNRSMQAAPPVYRPQPTPLVLQTKISSAHGPQAGQVTQPRRPPAAPAVYRPEPNGIAQPKIAYRPPATAVGAQAKMTGSSQVKTHPAVPPVYRPQPVPKVLQTKKDNKQQFGPRQQEQKRIGRPGSMPGAIQRQTGNVVQRDVDVASALKTENAQYMIVPSDTSVLYSEVDAPEPKPSGLYTRMNDRTSSKPHRRLYAWIPNVRFLSKEEQQASPSESKPGSYEYTTKGSFLNTTHRFSLSQLGQQIEDPPESGQRPTIGALGKNDCYAWADTLQNMMMLTEEMAGRAVTSTGRTRKNVHVSNPNSPADLRIEVGDMMRHLYINAKCKYHAATVVAKDGNSLVTLEGHVSKNITKPEFHIRGGVVDFADEAIRLGHGDEVEITPLETLNPETTASELGAFSKRYQRMTRADANDRGAVELAHQTASSNIGITFTNEVSRRRDELRRRREAEERQKARFQAVYEADRRIFLENERRRGLGIPLIPIGYTSFPSIE